MLKADSDTALDQQSYHANKGYDFLAKRIEGHKKSDSELAACLRRVYDGGNPF